MTWTILGRPAATFAGLVGFWLALVGAHDYLELVAGGVAAALALGTLAIVRTRARLPRPPGRARSWLRAGGPLARIPGDLVRLGAALAGSGPRGGDVRRARLPRPTDWRRHGERGAAELLASLGPNSVVLETTPAGTVLVHERVPTKVRPLS